MRAAACFTLMRGARCASDARPHPEIRARDDRRDDREPGQALSCVGEVARAAASVPPHCNGQLARSRAEADGYARYRRRAMSVLTVRSIGRTRRGVVASVESLVRALRSTTARDAAPSIRRTCVLSVHDMLISLVNEK